MSNSMQSHAPAPEMGAIQNTDRNNMNGDDSNIVDEILNELNDNNQNREEPVQEEIQQPSMNTQMHMDSEMQPDLSNQLENEMNFREQVEEPVHHIQMPPEVLNVEYNNNETKIETILNKLKKPLIITCLVFIVFNPLFMNLLANSIPRIFGPSDNIVMRQIRTLILALSIGLIFFGLNFVM